MTPNDRNDPESQTDRRPESQEARQADLAPETHNDEQDDHLSQAQDVAEDARSADARSPLDSVKPKGGNDGDSTQDLVDHMRDMESSGRIDMNAFRGEPNHDDDRDKFGDDRDEDEDRVIRLTDE